MSAYPLLRSLWRLARIGSLPGGLLAAHVHAYGRLAGVELTREWDLWRRRAMLQWLGLCGAMGAVGLSGVALMLWAAVPPAQVHTPWVLWLVPALPAAMSLGCYMAARAVKGPPAFGGVRRQWAADLALLRGDRTSG